MPTARQVRQVRDQQIAAGRALLARARAAAGTHASSASQFAYLGSQSHPTTRPRRPLGGWPRPRRMGSAVRHVPAAWLPRMDGSLPAAGQHGGCSGEDVMPYVCPALSE